MTIVTVRPDFKRDGRDRPIIIPKNGGKPTSYRRVTNYVSVLEDMYNLHRWEMRMVATGLADRADLLLAVAAHRDDKGRLNDICKEAKEAAKGNAGATTGTALHALTDMIDDGSELPSLPPGPAASLAAFKEATKSLKVISIEQKLVLDHHKVAGTADRIYEFEGQRYIGDTKSGNIELGILKICMQLAVYSRSEMYNVNTGKRTIHGCSVNRGIVMHMPATDDPAQAKCDLYWVDLESGWEAVKVAQQVWAQRSLKFKDLTEPFGSPPRPSLRLQKHDEAKSEADQAARLIRIENQLRASTSREDALSVWVHNDDIWTDELTAIAQARIAELDKLPAQT